MNIFYNSGYELIVSSSSVDICTSSKYTTNNYTTIGIEVKTEIVYSVYENDTVGKCSIIYNQTLIYKACQWILDNTKKEMK